MNNLKNKPDLNFYNNFDREEISNRFQNKPQKKSKKGKILFFTLLFIFIVAISFFSPVIISTKNILKNFGSGNFLGVWQTVVKLISAQDKLLEGEKDDRINILALGVGGKGHDGPYLTDTIILISIKPSEGKVSSISIPRDLYTPIPGYSWRKINNAYAFGEIEGQGGELISKVVGDIFEIPIHYYVVCDFEAFTKIINDLGGLDINVERSFTDNEFPTYDFKTRAVAFSAGEQKMSGASALEFVRSRHGNNGEGSDFARSQRQQKVLLAAKNKIFSLNTLINPTKISSILNNLNENIKTNIELPEIMRLANLVKNIDNSKTISKVIDNSANGLLYSDITADGAFILKPKAGNFKELSFLANNIFNEETNKITLEEKPISPKTKIVVQNGTTYPGLAWNTAENLKSLNFEIVHIGNAKSQNFEKTIIFDLTKGKKNESLDILKEKFNADIFSFLPEFLEENIATDFLIILGKNTIPVSTSKN